MHRVQNENYNDSAYIKHPLVQQAITSKTIMAKIKFVYRKH